MVPLRPILGLLVAAGCLLAGGTRCSGDGLLPWIKPEQRTVRVRHPTQLPRAALPDTPPPPTVSAPRWDAPVWNLSLDEAIRTSLSNSEIVRVLAGVAAVSSGRSIYDAAISNAEIDVAQGRFDPTVAVDNFWNRTENPFALIDPGDPQRTLIAGSQSDAYDLDFALSKSNLTGGVWTFGVADNTTRVPGPAPLNPSNSTALDLSYTQPLLQGGGIAVNQAPIVLARINVERSYFQYKSSVQGMVFDVIQAYWSLVSARTVLWARQQQVTQLEFALQLAEAQEAADLLSAGEVAQSKVSLASFRSALIAAKAEVVRRETALRSILRLPVTLQRRVTPSTPPSTEQVQFGWEDLLGMAEQYRPDLIELKLILEADQQRLLQARNGALPQLNAVANYRWNGLEGVMPVGDRVYSSLGENTGWTLGINFSVPIGLRAARAQLRQQELIIARDRANLDQGLQSASFFLAESLQNLDQFYEQYRATLETRAAARKNLEFQIARYQGGLTQYIVVLQAIVSWGDAVSAEADLLALYNIELANLQVQTGTILETHAVFFYEERYRSIGPLGCLGSGRCYPRANPPSDNQNVYPEGDRPSEEYFDLADPLEPLRDLRRRERDVLPPLDPPAPTEPFPDDWPEELPRSPAPRMLQPAGVLPEP
ncbi:Outer membrane efflux protein [Posidoniimonas corsicana]|uniref:Outer membrane efflux protein n=1 Tax=Posidoniimonas corsicana TaxID=1938618 RepID=A0A5C5VHC9_9BACT|nr:TolC family protein [Posidoniimonas corsicana]TWT37135.1 Outer membrane efflux protein [Posidoniimonas corsicana]